MQKARADVFPFENAVPAAELSSLSPSQSGVYDQLIRLLQVSPALSVLGAPGSGRSLLLKKLARDRGGQYLAAQDFLEAAAARTPLAWEDAFASTVTQAFSLTNLVVIDDFDFLVPVSQRNFVRYNYLRLAAKQVLDLAMAAPGRRLVVSAAPPPEGGYPEPFDVFRDRVPTVIVPEFKVEDYNAILSTLMGADNVKALDMPLIHRFASRLQGYQLRLAAGLLAGEAPSTEQFIAVLNRDILQSNTRTAEVEEITFDMLPGAEHMVEALETNIVLPLENRQLAQALGLKPKRGVLLYGPPGTGKTTIGRALAHRMRGKFFLIDGSFISEPPSAFFEKVKAVVKDAKENSPSVLFIDDADVLFKIDHISGLVRYLLSLLDGLESETARNVCVMMTAMNAKLIPDAMLRSGRVELWLETRLPDEAVRAKILARYVGTEMPNVAAVDYGLLGPATEGFTPADLRRIAGDAKALYAYELSRGRPTGEANEYLQTAINNIIADRNRMADTLGDDSVRINKGKYPMNTESCGWK